MTVIRLGYVHARVTDLAEAQKHYQGVLGLRLVEEESGRLFLKGWDEWDHHSVVLEEGGVGLVRMGFKCEANALEDIERKVTAFGVTAERMRAGEHRAVGDGIRVVLPSEHVVELYADMEYVGTDVGTLNPDPFPRDVQGAAVPRLDHVLVTTEEPKVVERFFSECLGFRTSERVITDPASAETIACFMSCTNTPHDIAFLKGPNGKLHHFAFQLEEWGEILRAADLLTMADTPIEISPTRHGITRGKTTYFFDPSGNRNEVFAGGYQTYSDFPEITWTADQIAKGIFYLEREMNETFATVVT